MFINHIRYYANSFFICTSTYNYTIMITTTRRINYWKFCQISEKLMETYLRVFRYNPHVLEVSFNRFNGKFHLVLTVNLYYTKDPNNAKIVKWHTRDYDSLTDLMFSNICFDL